MYPAKLCTSHSFLSTPYAVSKSCCLDFLAQDWYSANLEMTEQTLKVNKLLKELLIETAVACFTTFETLARGLKCQAGQDGLASAHASLTSIGRTDSGGRVQLAGSAGCMQTRNHTRSCTPFYPES